MDEIVFTNRRGEICMPHYIFANLKLLTEGGNKLAKSMKKPYPKKKHHSKKKGRRR